MSQLVRQVSPSQVDSQHQIHLLHGRLQSSRQTDGAGVVHQDVDSCQSDKHSDDVTAGVKAPSADLIPAPSDTPGPETGGGP